MLVFFPSPHPFGLDHRPLEWALKEMLPKRRAAFKILKLAAIPSPLGAALILPEKELSATLHLLRA